jgi:endothelin-converting enzyme
MSPVSLSEYYSGLRVSRDDYFKNYLASRQFDVKKEWQKVGTETDKTQWLMNPQEVNAYYNPTINEVSQIVHSLDNL